MIEISNLMGSENTTSPRVSKTAKVSTVVKEKKPRKARKQNEKEILAEYFQDTDQSNTNFNSRQHQQTKKVVVEHSFTNSYVNSASSHFTKPKNQRQEQLVNLLKNREKKMVFITGPAGTGKTLFATEYGINYFMQGVFEKLIFTRPVVSVDEDIGFLPGTMEEKLAPWVRPIFDVLYNFITPKEVQSLMEDKVIEIAPLGFLRGRTFKNAWIVVDEAQNTTMSQMKMLLTRLGENSRMIITGDLDQTDMFDKINGLQDFLNRFENRESVSISHFVFQTGDIQREEVVKEILDIYDTRKR